ncbi:Tim10/DDP family zinc finger protein [Actinidia rufa]|uniref:Tim10/DDP family zinc finger protein n=1 Tax=Actinidia rufa TaxID=165716 RepID=A0A7J0HA49_9ERIC|nr:Tim10/DDP family zinc finger protein [Actinidia rufa]
MAAANNNTPTQLDKEQIFGMAEKEMEYRVELFNKYKEAELNMGENSCIDRCVSKYWQEALSPGGQAELWKLEFSIAELGKQVTTVDSTKDLYTSLTLAWAIMLLNDVADLATEKASSISERMKEQSSELKKSKKKISSLVKQAKLDSVAVEQAKLALAMAIQERDASYDFVTEARELAIDLHGSRSNHFNPRSPKLDGNTRHISASSVNLSGVNFSGGSILPMSWENGVWYLRIGSIGSGLVVRATDPIRMMTSSDVAAIRLLSLARRSPSMFRLALSVSRRSMLERLMVMSQLSPLSGSNQPSFYLEVALVVLWALTSSLALLSPGVLGA